MKLKEDVQIGNKKLIVETGDFARQANGSASMRMGDTFVLVTAVASDTVNEGTDFLPLMVDYVEKTYSAGKIPGGYFKREGKPTEFEILTSRLIDRPIRPLFPPNYFNDTQIIALVLSADRENDPAILALTGASASLMFSDIPFNGPIAGVRVCKINGNLVANPSYEEQKNETMNIVLGVGKDGIVMVEGEAKFVKEQDLIDALVFGYEYAKPFLEVQEKMAEELGIKKRVLEERKLDLVIYDKVKGFIYNELVKALSLPSKKKRHEAKESLFKNLMLNLGDEFKERENEVKSIFLDIERNYLRKMILEDEKRIDGRGLNDIREIECRIGVLPRTHGSALFTRGETQALVSVTLGTTEDEQKLDLLTGETSKSFMLHYNFHPFSVGEVKFLRAPSRREIGHAYLAERSFNCVIPPKNDDFLYTIRVVSEILESNGSSSMATVCGASLALMDAGVPIKSHIAGIAMGLVSDNEKYAILSDILGDEDHAGDMDFKIAGNEDGISAIQMDIKTKKISFDVISSVLKKAKEGRLFILEKMKQTISAPKKEISPYAPRICSLTINPDRIKDLIGPSGRNIKSIIEKTGVAIEIGDNGKVNVSSPEEEKLKKAILLIRGLTEEPEVNKIYIGTVVKITDFGAFVRILPGVEGLLHISELSDFRVRRVEDVLKEGDEVMVKVIQIERSGRIRLSRKEALGSSSRTSKDQKKNFYDY